MIKGSIKVIFGVAIAVLVLSQVFLGMAMPVLNFVMGSELEEPNTEKERGTVIVHGDVVLNTDDPNLKPVATEEPEDPDATPEPPVSYEPGVVLETKTTKASSITFEEGTTNILLLGINTDEGNMDSIFVMNINKTTHVMKIVSIPRDTYVPHSTATVEAMKEDGFYYSLGSFKLNAVQYIGDNIIHYKGGKFNNSGIDYLCAVISQLLPGCNIDEYVYVDFDGFIDIIDILGGVMYTVPETIYDEYGNVRLSEGTYKLTGKEALTLVRYRYRRDSTGKNLGTGGDTFRKENQATFLANILGQVFTAENLSYARVISMMDSLKTSVHHTFSLSDVKVYIGVGLDYMNKMYSVEPLVIKGVQINPFNDGVYYSTLN